MKKAKTSRFKKIQIDKIDRMKIDRIERMEFKNIYGPVGQPTLLTFELKELKSDSDVLVACGSKRALPYLMRLLDEKGIAYTRLATHVRIYDSRQVLEEAVKDTQNPIIRLQ
jgi:hypothetical protein